MIIFIEHTALSDPNGEMPLREHALYALSMLSRGGHDIAVQPERFSDLQITLFKQEGIRLREPGDKHDAEVHAAEGKLKLSKDQATAYFSGWDEILPKLMNRSRTAELHRKTSETDIDIKLDLDGTGKSEIQTGLNFFDHMLEQISRHGFIDLQLNCKGDLQVDEHHTIEDVAIALGTAIDKALGDKKGIERYGFVLPMDETQARVAIDLSGRPYLVFEGSFIREYVGDMPTEMVKHFFYSLAMNLKATIHVTFSGDNDHHKIEACFKGLARSLKAAIERNERIKNQIPSSKGTL